MITTSRKVWLLIDRDAASKYVDPNTRYVRYSGDDDFAMFTHVPTNDPLEALRFDTREDAQAYLDKNRNGLMSPDTTLVAEATITVTIK